MKLILYLAVVIVLIFLYVRYLENTAIFFPARKILAIPDQIGLHFEDVFVTTVDHVKIHGWFVSAAGENQGTLLFFHGNAGNIGDRLEKIHLFHELGLNVFIIDYRGYGKSEGRPTEQGIYNDALAAYDYLLTRRDVNPKCIMAYGASLGGAPAVDLATKRPLSHLIIDSAFTNAADMAKTIYPFIPSFFLSVKLDLAGKVKDLTMPKLFIHSIEDETVPFELGQRLFEAAPEPKTFVAIRGTHNDGFVQDQGKFVGTIGEFLK